MTTAIAQSLIKALHIGVIHRDRKKKYRAKIQDKEEYLYFKRWNTIAKDSNTVDLSLIHI